MRYVVWCIDFTLQLQEAAEEVYDGGGTLGFFYWSLLPSNALQRKPKTESEAFSMDEEFSSVSSNNSVMVEGQQFAIGVVG